MDLGKKVKVVIAGSHAQFLEWCIENKTNPKDLFVKYPNKVQELRGLRNCEVIYYGTYWNSELFGHWILDEIKKS